MPSGNGILMGMSRTFKKVDYEQALDLTVRLGDCLPPEHLARFVVDSVALLDVSSLYAHYGSRGGEPYARGACYWACFSMAMRLVCGVSRKIERATYEAVPFRFIAGNQHPDHDTLATDRAHVPARTEGPLCAGAAAGTGGGRAETGDDQSGWDQDPC